MTDANNVQETQAQTSSESNELARLVVKSKAPSKVEKKAMIEKDLMKYLGSCTREFLDELALTFNDLDALEKYQYAHSTKKKREEIYRLILQSVDFDKFHVVRDFHNYVSGSAEDVAEAKRQYKETMDSYKSGLNSRVAGLRLEFEIKDDTRALQQEMQGKQQCCKVIENGLKGFGKAVVAGYIINKQNQVIASANYVALEASKISSNQNLEDKSLEGVKTVMKNVNPGVNNLVASLHNEEGELNAKADSLVVETADQMRALKVKIESFQQQGVGVGG